MFTIFLINYDILLLTKTKKWIIEVEKFMIVAECTYANTNV